MLDPVPLQSFSKTTAQPQIVSKTSAVPKNPKASESKEQVTHTENVLKSNTLPAVETFHESNVNIINPKRETTIDDIFETFEEASVTDGKSEDSFSQISKKVLIAAGAFLCAAVLTGLGIYLNNRRQ